MRKLVALAAAAAMLVLAGCSSQQGSTDPYQVLDQATKASYGDLVQLNLGLDGISAGQTVHLDPSAIRIVADNKAGKVDVALALPLDSLQVDAAARAQLGLTGDSLDLDIRYDGAGLYAKGQILQPLLTALVLQAGGAPGDYSGWVRLGTTAELTALAGNLVPQASLVPTTSASPAASHDAASLRHDLEATGITLRYVGREQRDGQQVDHLSATIDAGKLRDSPAAADLSGSELTQVEDALAQYDMVPDLWVAADSHRLTEVDLTLTPKADSASPAASDSDTVSFVLLVSAPSDDSALQTPSNATEVSLAPIVQSLLQAFGQGLFTTP